MTAISDYCVIIQSREKAVRIATVGMNVDTYNDTIKDRSQGRIYL